MILRLAAVCESAHERPDGRMDLAGVFNELSTSGFPARQDHMTVVFVIEWNPDESGSQPLRADLVDEQDRKLLTIQGHTDVDARGSGRAPARTRLVMPLRDVIFRTAGTYRFELLAGGDVVDACSFHVGLVRDGDG
jgi:hypothetical protein